MELASIFILDEIANVSVAWFSEDDMVARKVRLNVAKKYGTRHFTMYR